MIDYDFTPVSMTRYLVSMTIHVYALKNFSIDIGENVKK